MRVDNAPIGPAEADLAIADPFDAEAALVHQPVMLAAQQDEIADRGFAAIRPVANMMRIDEAVMVAARKAAAAVARDQGPAHRWRHRAGPAPDIERITRVVLGDPKQAAVAGDTAAHSVSALTCTTTW